MALNPQQLNNDLSIALADAAKESYREVFRLDISGEELTQENLSEIASTVFGDRFAEVLAPRLSEIIDSYIRSQTLVPNLVAPNGPVTGVITVT